MNVSLEKTAPVSKYQSMKTGTTHPLV